MLDMLVYGGIWVILYDDCYRPLCYWMETMLFYVAGVISIGRISWMYWSYVLDVLVVYVMGSVLLILDVLVVSLGCIGRICDGIRVVHLGCIGRISWIYWSYLLDVLVVSLGCIGRISWMYWSYLLDVLVVSLRCIGCVS